MSVCSSQLIIIDLLSSLWHGSHAAHNNESVLRLIIDTVENSVDVSRRDIVDHIVEHRVFGRLLHRTLSVSRFVFLNKLVGKADLRALIVAPDVEIAGLIQSIFHRSYEARPIR